MPLVPCKQLTSNSYELGLILNGEFADQTCGISWCYSGFRSILQTCAHSEYASQLGFVLQFAMHGSVSWLTNSLQGCSSGACTKEKLTSPVRRRNTPTFFEIRAKTVIFCACKPSQCIIFPWTNQSLATFESNHNGHVSSTVSQLWSNHTLTVLMEQISWVVDC